MSTQWYQFGLAIGVPGEYLETLNGCPDEECLVELLDYWLRHHPDQPTWKEVADAVKDIGDHQLQLANSIYDLAGKTI